MSTRHTIAALAPEPTRPDPDWSAATLRRILATPPRRRRLRRRVGAGVAGAVVALTAGAAFSGVGPAGVVRDALRADAHDPDNVAHGIGTIPQPSLVARFPTANGLWAQWVAVTSKGVVCSVGSFGTWNGEGVPKRSDLARNCGNGVVDKTDSNRVVELTRPDQIGGFIKDIADAGPVVFGVAPYDDAVSVRVTGRGVDRTLPVRANSHGYGVALPEAEHTRFLLLTFLDGSGHRLGTTRLMAVDERPGHEHPAK